MKFNYCNWTTELFAGFYESILFNSDTLYNLNLMDCIPDGYTYDIKDFNKFMDDVGNKATDILADLLPNDIIKSMEFIKISSPHYYNFETDRLIIGMDLNLNKLKQFCFKDNKESFNEYLKDNFTSYDGFISYISNSIQDFIYDYNTKPLEKDRLINVMVEFYILNNISIECYEDRLYGETQNLLWQHVSIYEDDDYELNNPIEY